MAKKEKQRLTGIRLVINILGILHYLFGFFQLLMLGFALLPGVSFLGAEIKAGAPALLSFLRSWSDTLVGILMIIATLISVAAQIYIGWNWRRKARNAIDQKLAIILLGVKTVRALYTILQGGILSASWRNIYALILNGVSLALAVWIHTEYRKNKQE